MNTTYSYSHTPTPAWQHSNFSGPHVVQHDGCWRWIECNITGEIVVPMSLSVDFAAYSVSMMIDDGFHF